MKNIENTCKILKKYTGKYKINATWWHWDLSTTSVSEYNKNGQISKLYKFLHHLDMATRSLLPKMSKSTMCICACRHVRVRWYRTPHTALSHIPSCWFTETINSNFWSEYYYGSINDIAMSVNAITEFNNTSESLHTNFVKYVLRNHTRTTTFSLIMFETFPHNAITDKYLLYDGKSRG